MRALVGSLASALGAEQGATPRMRGGASNRGSWRKKRGQFLQHKPQYIKIHAHIPALCYFDINNVPRRIGRSQIYYNISMFYISSNICDITKICAEPLLARWVPHFDYNSPAGNLGAMLAAVTHDEDAGWPAPAWAPGLTQRESFLVLRKTIPPKWIT